MKAWHRKGYLATWCDAIMQDVLALTERIQRAEAAPAIRQKSDDGDELAWFQDITATGVEVTGGPITWGHQLLEEFWQDHVEAFGGTPFAVAYPTEAGDHCLYVKVSLGASPVTIEVLFGAKDLYPVDDPANLVVNFPLSVWRTVTGTAIVVLPCTRVYTLHESGRLNIPSYFAPPRT
jgi:hypothetical protein